MTALTQNTNRPRRAIWGKSEPLAVEDAVIIYEGALVTLKGAEYTKATTATGEKGVGVATEYVDNTNDGKTVVVEYGIFEFDNDGDADAISAADIGKTAYATDDDQVTDTATGRSPIGTIVDYDAVNDKVWVAVAPWIAAHGAQP